MVIITVFNIIMSKILDTPKLLKEVLDMKKDLENDTAPSKENYKSKYNYLSTFDPTLFDTVYKNKKDYLMLLKEVIYVLEDHECLINYRARTVAI